MSRAKAKKMFTIDDHVQATRDVECRKDADVIDETPMAYKDIDDVMAAQSDLVDVVHTLKQVVCVKGWWTLWYSMSCRALCTTTLHVTCCGSLLRYASQVVTQCFRLKGMHEESLERYWSKPVFYASCNSSGLSTFKCRPQKISCEGY